jgi:hypothetical protein
MIKKNLLTPSPITNILVQCFYTGRYFERYLKENLITALFENTTVFCRKAILVENDPFGLAYSDNIR